MTNQPATNPEATADRPTQIVDNVPTTLFTTTTQTYNKPTTTSAISDGGNNSQISDDKKGLSRGEMAGVIVATVGVVIAIVGVLCEWHSRSKAKVKMQSSLRK
jgi:hypothetical protein